MEYVRKQRDAGDLCGNLLQLRRAIQNHIFQLALLLLALGFGYPVQAQNWCGQTVTYDNNQLPAGWTITLIRNGPGIINNRLEGHPTDSGGEIHSPNMNMVESVDQVTVEYDVNLTTSYWGQHHGIQFTMKNGENWWFSLHHATYRLNEALASNVYRGGLLFGQTAPNPPPTIQIGSEQIGAFIKGQHHARLLLTPGMARWEITNASTGQIITRSQALPIDFHLSNLSKVHHYAYTTTGGSIWSDNFSATCPVGTGITWPLSLNSTGAGTGIVTSDVGGINCIGNAGTTAGQCTATLANDAVILLTAIPGDGSTFSTWSGCSSQTTDSPPKCKVSMDSAKTVGFSFAIAGCESSSVATITANGYAYADKYQAFDVVCQSGRYGVVRLPQWYLPGLLKVCSFQQGTCQAKPSAQCTSSPSIAALKTINDNRSASTSALLTDPTLGPLANWICQ